jgi:hypothetical protein
MCSPHNIATVTMTNRAGKRVRSAATTGGQNVAKTGAATGRITGGIGSFAVATVAIVTATTTRKTFFG